VPPSIEWLIGASFDAAEHTTRRHSEETQVRTCVPDRSDPSQPTARVDASPG